MPKGAAAAPVKKVTSPILMGVVGIVLLAWAIAWLAPPGGPIIRTLERAAAAINLKNFLLKISFDIILASFLMNIY
jgi:hypothetical protein